VKRNLILRRKNFSIHCEGGVNINIFIKKQQKG